MQAAHRQDVQGATCPDCGSQVYRQYVVPDDKPAAPAPPPDTYGCRGDDCGWTSPNLTI